MNIVQKKDPWGNWVEVYRAQTYADAQRFYKGIARGKAKDITRIIKM